MATPSSRFVKFVKFVRFVRFVVEKEKGGLSGLKKIDSVELKVRQIGYAELKVRGRKKKICGRKLRTMNMK